MFGPIIDIIGRVLEKVIPNADERARARDEITKQLLDNQAAIYDAMKTVMAADAASESWMTRNARPSVVFWSIGMMTWVVISPIFKLQVATIESIKAIPSDLWNIALVGIGGYMLAKTVTDTVKSVRGK